MRLALTAAALVVASGAALAQTSGATTQGTAPPTQGHAALAHGRNSFTQRQAANRIAKAGFTDVSGLKKDNQGVWRGTAQKDGSKVDVSLDYKGDVVGQ